MALEAPAILIALEQSALGTAIRQSVWIYPAANTVHILGLTLLAASVAVMDLRLLGAFRETVPAAVIVPARRLAMLGLTIMVLSGLVLFTAEATHVAMNPVFQIKMGLIGLAILNALVVPRTLPAVLIKSPAMTRTSNCGLGVGSSQSGENSRCRSDIVQIFIAGSHRPRRRQNRWQALRSSSHSGRHRSVRQRRPHTAR